MGDVRVSDNSQLSKPEGKARDRSRKWREANPKRAQTIRHRYEQKHPGKHREWYVANRQRIIEKGRQRRHARRVHTSAEQLAQCQADLLLAKTIRGPEAIVCLECGLLCKCIRPTHLREHGLSAAEYREKWGYSQRTGLISDRLAAGLRRRAEQGGNLRPEAGLHYRRRTSAKGRTMSREFRLKHSRRMRGIRRPDLSKGTSDGKIVRSWLLEGRPIKEVAVKSRLSEGAVHKRLQAIFGVKVKQKILFSQGEPVTDSWINKLLERFGRLKKAQLGQLAGVSVHYLQQLSAGKKNRSITPNLASVLVATEQVFFEVLAGVPGDKADYIRAVVPDLDRKYLAAVAAITMSLNVYPRRLESELDHLAQDSRLEVARGNGFQARTTLAWLPEAFAWLKQSTTNSSPGELARAFLASQYKTKEWIVKKALASSEPAQTKPDTIRALILASPLVAARRRKRIGRPLGKKEETPLRRIKLAAELELKGYTHYKMANLLYPLEAAKDRKLAEDATKKFFRRNRAAVARAKAALPAPASQTLSGQTIHRMPR
jgi:hypothetical protein